MTKKIINRGVHKVAFPSYKSNKDMRKPNNKILSLFELMNE